MSDGKGNNTNVQVVLTFIDDRAVPIQDCNQFPCTRRTIAEHRAVQGTVLRPSRPRVRNAIRGATGGGTAVCSCHAWPQWYVDHKTPIASLNCRDGARVGSWLTFPIPLLVTSREVEPRGALFTHRPYFRHPRAA